MAQIVNQSMLLLLFVAPVLSNFDLIIGHFVTKFAAGTDDNVYILLLLLLF